jgi:hypothetical protein
VFFVSWERYGRASGRFGGAVSYVGELGGAVSYVGELGGAISYVGELGGNQERLG